MTPLLFCYDKVLHRPLSQIEGIVRARRPRRLPVVLRREEVGAVLDELAAAVRTPLDAHLDRVRRQHAKDLERGLGRAPLPDPLARKYRGADRRGAWQWVFLASSHYVDRDTGLRHRHHLRETVVQRAVKDTVRRAGVTKPA